MKRMLRQEIIEALDKIDFEELASNTAWVSQMKELISVDDEENQIVVNAHLSIPSIEYLTNADTDSYFPDLTDQAGKSVVVNQDETGFEYKDPSSFMTQLTHSLDELDPTIKQIIYDAITDDWADGVACSEAQWEVIKSLLDKSLYLNYNGYSMIKVCSTGNEAFAFGSSHSNLVYSSSIELYYDTTTNLLYVKYIEL